MTPFEMRQKAARNRTRSAVLDSAAARLRVIADQIRYLLSDLSARSRRVWRGPAATNFEQRAETADAEVKAEAAALVSTAADFESEARRLRGEAASLEAQAAAVETSAVPAAGGDASVPATVA